MIHYHVSFKYPHRHFISFEARFLNPGKNELLLQLPSWRPGRYELGNFSKNVRGWKATGKKGELLSFTKRTKDLWCIDAEGIDEVMIHYEYYASELNAGSSYLDDDQLYINPVNCFFFDPERPELNYIIDFSLPEGYEIACGLKKEGPHRLRADNFDELADCPLIASGTLRHLNYSVDNYLFHLVIQGEYRIDEERLIEEFKAFSELHIRIFRDMPCSEYFFLFQFTPFFVRHGVEHRNSTVIAMGPAADFMNKSFYDRLLGISCHELYHTWNVKNIRPIEMMPYDFTRENYCESGFITEGVTTYFGDLLLFRSGIYSEIEWFDILSTSLQTHFDNYGRQNYSVAESSWDTWLDGYSSGIPWRKVSIYNEGCLVAFICDIEIMRATSDRRSLDDAMRLMYERFGKTKSGYCSDDYMKCLEETAGISFVELFKEIVHGHGDYMHWLQVSFEYLGLIIEQLPGAKWNERYLGFRVEESNSRLQVSEITPNSPADRAGLWYGDEIIAVNGAVPYKNFDHLLKLGSGKDYVFSLVRKNRFVHLHLREDGRTYFERYMVRHRDTKSELQVAAYNYWAGRRI